jgi:3-deoxy-D-manno-octulosonate 8-phosphate phosphatase (KDO 8-P phosphatase)
MMLGGGETVPTTLLDSIRLVVFDFDGVFTDNFVYVFEDGREAVRCTRADGLGLARLREVGISTLVLSTETNPVVQRRCQKLKVECISGCPDKRATLIEFATERRLQVAAVAYVGNDVNDAGCLTAVGLPIVVADAHPEVLPLARYQTRCRGGHGAVREICDLFFFGRTAVTSAQ